MELSQQFVRAVLSGKVEDATQLFAESMAERVASLIETNRAVIAESLFHDGGEEELPLVSESNPLTELDNHFSKANTLEYSDRRGHGGGHDFTSHHDHKQVVGAYRSYLKNPTGKADSSNIHSKLTKPVKGYGNNPNETEFLSHHHNVEEHGHNTIHSIASEKNDDGTYTHSISHVDNNG